MGTAVISVVVSLAVGALGASPARADGPALSGTQEYGGNTVTWATSGAQAPPASLAGSYAGTVAPGATVTFSGSMSYSIGAGGVTNLSQSASLSGSSASVSFSQRVGEGTYTTPFSLTAVAPKPPKGWSGKPGDVIATITASASSRNCNDSGMCGGPTITLNLAVVAGQSGSGTGTTPTTSDTTNPVVSIRPSSKTYGIGARIPVTFSVTDDSKKARWLAFLYSGGTPVAKGTSDGLAAATGAPIKREWGREGGGSGPFYYCIQATDAAGNSSDIACQWVSAQVAVTPISNGCGTAEFGATAEQYQNYYGDTRTYEYGDDEFSVSVRNACNIHDAAYAGATVFDPVAKKTIDFRTWSRSRIDTHFRNDIRTICKRQVGTAVRRQDILRTCLNGVSLVNLAGLVANVGPAKAGESVGADTYLELVRTFGGVAFDADATVPGIQPTTPSTTLPSGGARLND